MHPMDFNEDEPRKHPKPVPFFQNIAKPIVPEVSLLEQKNLGRNKNEFFSGSEFQTYNAWRWKYTDWRNKADSSTENKIGIDCSNGNDCCLIKDKYSSSVVEKRKNEILYGQSDEPRRPLPPRPIPVIPQDIFCTDSTFSTFNEFDEKKKCTVTSGFHQRPQVALPLETNASKDSDNSDKLYSIISEQSKQIEVLQKQIEQILKLQEVKDNQIEQMLKLQQSKEIKIDQLLLSLEVKEKEISKLLRIRDSQEDRIKDLLASNDSLEKEKSQLLKNTKNKETATIGVLTVKQTCDSSTNTSFLECGKYSFNKKDEIEEISSIRDLNENSELNGRDRSLSLHSMDLPVIQEQVPTPQTSIHIDIQDFRDTSEDSDSDSVGISSKPSSSEVYSTPLGYTFYDNLITQVKDIIHNSGGKQKVSDSFSNKKTNKVITDRNCIQEQRSTVKSFQSWEVCQSENPLLQKNQVNFGERVFSNIQATQKDNSPSDISLKMNALALKYLKKEQILECDYQPPLSSPRHDVTIYNVTNLSFGTMRYLDRYRILPNSKISVQNSDNNHQNLCSSPQIAQKKISSQGNISVENVLDISALKNHNKLF